MSQLADKNWQKKASMNKVPEVKEHCPFTLEKHSSAGYSGYLIFLKGFKSPLKNRFSTVRPEIPIKDFYCHFMLLVISYRML